MEPGRGETLNGQLQKHWHNATITLTNQTEPLFWEVYEVSFSVCPVCLITVYYCICTPKLVGMHKKANIGVYKFITSTNTGTLI